MNKLRDLFYFIKNYIRGDLYSTRCDYCNAQFHRNNLNQYSNNGKFYCGMDCFSRKICEHYG